MNALFSVYPFQAFGLCTENIELYRLLYFTIIIDFFDYFFNKFIF